jgi:hypothetical protein
MLQWQPAGVRLEQTMALRPPSRLIDSPNRSGCLPLLAALVAGLLGGGSPARAQAPFPFTISGDRFLLRGQPVFLHLLAYQPLEPGQAIGGEIRAARVLDDLRRWQDWRGGNQPVVLRVYAQPTAEFPVRVPKSFYDGIRQLGWWIVRDIYFEDDYTASAAISKGKVKVDAVVNEVAAVGGFDRVFAWEIGNEFRADTEAEASALKDFVCAMTAHLKTRMAEPGREVFSKWVTWGSWAPNDPLRSAGNPVVPPCLDFVSYNAYSYDPERLRDHQAGPATGRPYAGYLAALKERYPNVPVVISETGLPDSPSPAATEQQWLHPWSPSYRAGGLSSAQVAEGLAERYWDARLSGTVAGGCFFEWNDEWHKAGEPGVHNDHPEEHYGLLGFRTTPRAETRAKAQLQTVRDLFAMQFPSSRFTLSVQAEATSLPASGQTTLRAAVGSTATQPVRFRWESNRGFIAGDGATVEFYAGGVALGPATITVVALDADGFARSNSVTVQIERPGPPRVEILTFGEGANSVARASGRVSNVTLAQHKLVAFVQTNQKYVQPFLDMKSIWVRPDGFWWTPVDNRFNGQLVVHVVPVGFDAPATLPIGAVPPGTLATATRATANDRDNDLLPDTWEPSPDATRYDDGDADGADNLEEWLAGTSPATPDNDRDGDGLPDNWERRFFGELRFGAADDPDNDGRSNQQEFAAGTHPSRAGVDNDQDGLPDSWEQRFFGALTAGATEDADGDGVTNLHEYEFGSLPVSTPPRLSFRFLTSTELELSWPAYATDYLLQTTDRLALPATWTAEPQPPLLLGNLQVLLVRPRSEAAGFYRLMKR